MKRLLVLAIAAALMSGCNQTQASQTTSSASSQVTRQSGLHEWVLGTWISEAGAKLTISRNDITFAGDTLKYQWTSPNANTLNKSDGEFEIDRLPDGRIKYGKSDNDGQNQIFHRE